jgi:hypothetical protein
VKRVGYVLLVLMVVAKNSTTLHGVNANDGALDKSIESSRGDALYQTAHSGKEIA